MDSLVANAAIPEDGATTNRPGFALVGVNGFGSVHLHILEKLEKEGLLEIKAICDSNPVANSDMIDRIAQRRIGYFDSFLEMLLSTPGLDTVTICTPIHLHKRMAIEAMENGYDVLLEKPPAVSIQDLDEIIRTAAATGRRCIVDFMWTEDRAFKELIALLEKGVIGRVQNIVGVGKWKRLDNYYARTDWSGKLTFHDQLVLDGTLFNPFSHLLNNMLLLASASGAGRPVSIVSELYHAHPIEGEDTSCLRASMEHGIDLHFYTTLCAPADQIPRIEVEGSGGSAVWNYDGELIIEGTAGTTTRKYAGEDNVEKIYRAILAGSSVGPLDVRCRIEDTRDFVLTANAAFESTGSIHTIPPDSVSRRPSEGSIETEIQDICDIIDTAAREKRLFSEIGVKWAVPGKLFCVDGYNEFRMFPS